MTVLPVCAVITSNKWPSSEELKCIYFNDDDDDDDDDDDEDDDDLFKVKLKQRNKQINKQNTHILLYPKRSYHTRQGRLHAL